MAKVNFGSRDCSSIEVDPFSGICDYTAPGKSEPLTIDVPVPSFTHPLPPNECACFEFTPGTGTAEKAPNCNTSTAKASVEVEITQADANDCCSGKYKVVPKVNIDMPCIPFTVKQATSGSGITIRNKSGISSHGTDGGISLFKTNVNCCSLEPVIEMTVPDCIKTYDKLGYGGGSQIKCCDNGTQVGFDILEMKEDPVSCNVYPVFHPITLPCCMLPDETLTKSFKTDNYGGTATMTLKREKCNTSLEITSNPKNPPCACFTFDKTTSNVTYSGSTPSKSGTCTVEITRVGDCCNYQYKVTPTINLPNCTLDNQEILIAAQALSTNAGGSISGVLKRTNCSLSLSLTVSPITVPDPPGYCPTSISTDDITMTATVDKSDGSGTEPRTTKLKFTLGKDEHGCPCYTGAFSDALDLTGLGGGGSITNGGDVYKSDTDKKLYIDGTGHASNTWYGGGIGDLKTDAPTKQFCRGEIMRNGASPYGYYSNQNPIPYAMINAQRIMQNCTGSTACYNTAWMSRRSDTTKQEGYATGNLSMYIPTGAQWHTRGTALVMSHLMFNDSGVLSYMNEPGETNQSAAVLVSPAPAVLKSDTNKNASGLSVLPSDWATTTCKVTSGLSIKDGAGVRLYGVGDGSHDTNDKDDATNRQGSLEILYGAGFRVIKNKDQTTSANKYRNYPMKVNDAIEPNYGRGMTLRAISSTDVRSGKLELNENSTDFMFYCSGKSTTTTADNEEAAKLCFNDKTNNADIYAGTYFAGTIDTTKYPGYTQKGIGNKWGRSKAGGSRSNDVILPFIHHLTVKKNTDGLVTNLVVQAGWLRFTDNGILLAVYTDSSSGNAAPYGLPVNTVFDTYRADSTKILT